MSILGLERVEKLSLVLPDTNGLGTLALDITIARPPTPSPLPPIILYVLDPEPILFGAAALHAFAGSTYYRSAPLVVPESLYHRLYIVGVGHAPEEFTDGRGIDAPALRQLRRRDFPPVDHPSVRPGGRLNARARRFSTELARAVFPHVEAFLELGTPRPAHRALLGASYSAVLALQTLYHAPGAVDSYILGSPSVPFDPIILEWLGDTSHTLGATAHHRTAAFIAFGAQEREETPPDGKLTQRLQNVHHGIPDGASRLADILRGRGLAVDGPAEIDGEDHTSLKLSLVSRGISWLLIRAHAVVETRPDGAVAARSEGPSGVGSPRSSERKRPRTPSENI
jgi:hypothetical protein